MVFKSNRRGFVQQVAAIGAAASVPVFALHTRPALAQGVRTLTVGWDSDVDSLDPTVFKSIGGYAVQCNIYDGPLTWKVSPTPGLPDLPSSRPGEFEGNVAESWAFERNGATLVLKIRRGMTFPSGRPITAESVKFMLDRALLSSGYMRFVLPRMLRVSAPGDFVVRDSHTLAINMPAPTPMALEMMSLMTTGLLDEALVKEHATADDQWAGNWLKFNGAGSGPYQIVSKTPGVGVIMEARKDHWAGAPYFQRVELKFIPSEADRVLLLKRRAIDLVIGRPGLGPKSIASLKNEPGLKTITVPDTSGHWVCMNETKAPFNNVLVRRAINYAIPINAIIPNVLQGFGTAMKSPLPALTPGYDGTLSPFKYDIEKAKALMKEAGLGDKPIPVKLSCRLGWEAHEQAAVWIQQELQKIGFQVSIERQTDAAMRQLASNGQLELSIETFLSWVNDPFFLLNVLFHSKSKGTNTAFYNNPAFDKIIDDNFHEPDREKRMAAAKEAQKILIDDAVIGFLWHDSWTRVMRSDLVGVEKRWDGFERFRNLKLA
jgi:peptide/nickel transport system substrate-binding protein